MELYNDLLLQMPLAAKLFGIKFYDEDLIELLLRLALNIGVSYTIILGIFKSTKKDSEYIFTYLVFSPMLFFICHLSASTKLSIGFAFGLFAVFSILRYRTTTIPVKEMTYMFVIIGVAVINAISTKKISYAELLFTNFFIMVLLYLMERYLFTNNVQTQNIIYENIENIKVGKEQVLIADLKERTGLDILRYEVIEADYLKDAARLRIYFKSKEIND